MRNNYFQILENEWPRSKVLREKKQNAESSVYPRFLPRSNFLTADAGKETKAQ